MPSSSSRVNSGDNRVLRICVSTRFLMSSGILLPEGSIIIRFLKSVERYLALDVLDFPL